MTAGRHQTLNDSQLAPDLWRVSHLHTEQWLHKPLNHQLSPAQPKTNLVGGIFHLNGYRWEGVLAGRSTTPNPTPHA